MELAAITHFCEFLTASGAGDIQLDLEMADLLKVSHTHTQKSLKTCFQKFLFMLLSRERLRVCVVGGTVRTLYDQKSRKVVCIYGSVISGTAVKACVLLRWCQESNRTV